MNSLLVIASLVTVVLIVLTHRTIDSAKKQPYRLGDYIRRAGGFEKSTYVGRHNYFFYGLSRPRNSIVRQYGSKTREAENVQVLSEIVRTYDAPRSTDTLTVHLRLGDVIDNHERSVDDFMNGNYQVNEELWDSMNGRRWRGSSCTAQRCETEGYVKPLDYFKTLLLKVPSTVRRVILISGSHVETKNPQKSTEYLQRLQRFFEQNGFEVEVRWNNPPDEDFVLMSNANYFVPTGGGFSELIVRVVQKFGGTVIT